MTSARGRTEGGIVRPSLGSAVDELHAQLRRTSRVTRALYLEIAMAATDRSQRRRQREYARSLCRSCHGRGDSVQEVRFCGFEIDFEGS